MNADKALAAFDQEVRNRGTMFPTLPAKALFSPPVSYLEFKPSNLIRAANLRTKHCPVHQELRLYIAAFVRMPDLHLLTVKCHPDHSTRPNAWSIPHLTRKAPFNNPDEPTIRQLVVDLLNANHVVAGGPTCPYELYEEVSPLQMSFPQATGLSSRPLHVCVLVEVTDMIHFAPKRSLDVVARSYTDHAWMTYNQIQELRKLGHYHTRLGWEASWLLSWAFQRTMKL